MEKGEIVEGLVTGKVKGGLTVMVNGIRAFLPGLARRPASGQGHVAVRRQADGIQGHQARPQAQQRRRLAPRSARETMGAEREELLKTLQEGAIVKGIVKNITDYGAFVDLGGIDGLLHITDLAWRRVKHPSEVLTVGDEVEAKILKFDQEKNRVSLGMKQLGEDPWVGIGRRYPQGTRLFGKVTNLTDYGAFVEIEQGIEGLVHVSEMDWTNKNIHPSKVVQLGDEVEVMILEIDEDRRRISLGMKQCMPNPWEEFAMNHKKGDKVTGPDQVDHRLRRVHRPARRHRRPRPPVRPALDAARRGSRQAVPQGPGSRSGRHVDRRRARAHLARHQADRRRSVQQLHRDA
jgi:small subunit ribosomal protein S1